MPTGPGVSRSTPASRSKSSGSFEQPPLTEEEAQREKEKADAEQAAAAFAKGKSRWKTVDEDGTAGKFDPSRPAGVEANRSMDSSQAQGMDDEAMSDIDGVPMDTAEGRLAYRARPIDIRRKSSDLTILLTAACILLGGMVALYALAVLGAVDYSVIAASSFG